MRCCGSCWKTDVYPRRRTLKRPTATELLSDYAAARSWAAELSAGAGPYRLETVEVGRTTIGSNRLPAAAVFETAEDEVAFAGKAKEAARFRRLVAGLAELDATACEALRSWALKRPLQLLELDEAALKGARVALWLRDNPSPGIYLRQLSLPGVHTKFIEAHRKVIDEMVALLRVGLADAQTGRADDEPVIGAVDDAAWLVRLAAPRLRASPRGTASCIRRSWSGSGSWIPRLMLWVTPTTSR